MLVKQITLNTVLFIMSLCGMIVCSTNLLIFLMCIELMLLSINLNFIAFTYHLDDLYGHIFSLFILTIAAAESAIGLAILISYYRQRGDLTIRPENLLRF